MARYRKLFVAIVGALALFVPEVAGVDAGALYDAGVGVLLALGVFAIPNAPAKGVAADEDMPFA